MAEEAERTFAKTFLNMLSTQSIAYSDDYQQPPELSLRRVPVLPVSLSLIPFPWLLYAIIISSLNPKTDYCSFTSVCLRSPIYKSLDCCAATPRTRTSTPAIWIFIRFVSFPISCCKFSACWCKHFDGHIRSLASISLVFKSLKPQATFTISVRLTDTISAIKTRLAAEPSAPPVYAQRLLFKGKALVDGKLLKEYGNIKDGDTVNLMVKPGYEWNTTTITTVPTPPVSASPMLASSPEPLSVHPSPFGSGTLHPEVHSKQGGRRHQRIPSVLLSPSSSLESSGAGEKDIMLTIDPGVLPSPVLQPDTMSTYNQTMSQPEFWERLHDFLKYILPYYLQIEF